MGIFTAALLTLLVCVAVAGWVAPDEHTITCCGCGHESTGPTYRDAYRAHIIHNYDTHPEVTL